MARASAAALLACLGACTTASNQPTTSGANCGPGTIEVNGVCEAPQGPAVGIQNGDAAASATSHWTGKVGFTFNLTFYGDHTGVFWAVNPASCGYDCPLACPTTRPTLCGDVCVDTTASTNACGGCGKACASGQVCAASTCGSPDAGGPSSEPGNGCTISNPGGSGIFQWSTLAAGGILNARADGRPFKNLTNIQGGVGDGNFRATVDGAATASFTLGSGPPCP